MLHSLRRALTCLMIPAAACLMPGCGDGSESQSADPAGTPDQSIVPAAAPVPLPPISFNEDIRPILSDKCFACHGPDRKHREADLRLDIEEAAKASLGSYAALVAGDRDKSEVWTRINDTTDPMPPKKSHKVLEPQEIELIGRWIDEGATYETHWAYVKPVRHDLPTVTDQAWNKNPVDRFIHARLEPLKIKPSPQADKRTLLRRVSYDLTGLPPTQEQAQAFLTSDAPDAYEQLVDSLLQSPAFGEHLAVWWLDQVRYSDTIGIHSDNPRSVWPYRAWVIRAFNDNLPFDQFTLMQIAGDLMQDEPTADMLTASAYNRLSPQTEEGGAQPKEYNAIYNADRVANYGDVWLGSSVNCAQCHDHKFDPFTIEDYYAMTAFFADINQPLVSHDNGYGKIKAPLIFLPENEEQAAQVQAVEAEYQAFHAQNPTAKRAEERFSSRDPLPPFPDGWTPEQTQQLNEILKKRSELAKTVPFVVVTRARDEPREVRVLQRGNWQDDSGQVMQPATPAFLPGIATEEGGRLTRLELARWTVSPENPLTTRVVVNRLWGRYLGNPLSSNTVDLGSQGTPPTHPKLLDYLAVDFRDNGWNLKQLIRQIVTSETYKQSSDAREDLVVIDPDNRRLFARQSPLRLPAEAIRDQALMLSGLLNSRIGGPSVFPYQPAGVWEPLNFPARDWPTSKGEDLYRRGLYTWIQRTFPHPQMITFDAPSRESCTGQRMMSTTPLQALASLNAPVFVESARVLAEHLIQQEADDAKRLEKLFNLALVRPPRESESATLLKLLQSQRTHFAASPEDAKKLSAVGEAPEAQGLDVVEVAAWTSVCRVVLNLHETITRN